MRIVCSYCRAHAARSVPANETHAQQCARRYEAAVADELSGRGES